MQYWLLFPILHQALHDVRHLPNQRVISPLFKGGLYTFCHGIVVPAEQRIQNRGVIFHNVCRLIPVGDHQRRIKKFHNGLSDLLIKGVLGSDR